MRRILVVLMVGVVLMGGSLVSGANAKKPKKVERTESMTYDLGRYGGAHTFPVSQCTSPRIGCTEFTSGPKEKYASFEIKDQTGLAVLGQVDINGETTHLFCRNTELPLKIEPNAEITVWAQAHEFAPIYACGAGGGSPTTGTVTVTFSNVP